MDDATKNRSLIAKLLDGQERRAWLDRQDERLTNGLRYYLGPAAEPVEGIARIASALSSGQDFVDAREYGGRLMSGQGSMAGNLAGLGGAGLGMFLGPAAKIADHAALDVAQRLAGEGADARRIWDETGWFEGADGKWRFEIDDSKAGLTPAVDDAAQRRMHFESYLPDAVSHPDLIEAYAGTPQSFARSPFMQPMAMDRAQGAYYPAQDQLIVSPRAKDRRSTALHELQHATQRREGFAQGGSPEALIAEDLQSLENERSALWQAIAAQPEQAAKDDWWNGPDGMKAGASYSDYRGPQTPEMARFDDLDREIAQTRTRGFEDYQRLAGEVEARNVQARRDMTMDERRATPPWETEDVPRARQIVRGIR